MKSLLTKKLKGFNMIAQRLNPRPANIVKYNIPKFMKNSESNTNW